MSRLFEALSGLKAEHRVTEVVTPLTMAPPAAIPSISKQEAKPENHSLKVVQSAVDPLAMAQAESVQEIKVLNEAVWKPSETVEPSAVLVSALPESP